MLMYHQIKFGNKKISSSVDMVKYVHFSSPHSNPKLEDSKPIFSYVTFAHEDESQYQV